MDSYFLSVFSFAQDSSKNSHVASNNPVYYDKLICSWEMGERGEGNLGMEYEYRSAKYGDGRGLPIGVKAENENPERKEGTAAEVNQLKSAGRRQMEDGDADVEGSTKGEEDSAESVEEEGKDDEEKEEGVVPERKVTELEMAVEGQHEEVSQEEEKEKKASPKRKRRRRRRRQAEPQHGAVMKSVVCCWNVNMKALLKMITKEPFLCEFWIP